MSEDSETPPPPGGQFLVYQTEDGKLKLDVRFEGETVWLTQQHMAELFQTTKQNVSLHIQNIYEELELERGATVKESLTVQLEGKRSVQRRVEFYILDVIISVGYRVNASLGNTPRHRASYPLVQFGRGQLPFSVSWKIESRLHLEAGNRRGRSGRERLLARNAPRHRLTSTFENRRPSIAGIDAPARRSEPTCGNHGGVTKNSERE